MEWLKPTCEESWGGLAHKRFLSLGHATARDPNRSQAAFMRLDATQITLTTRLAIHLMELIVHEYGGVW